MYSSACLFIHVSQGRVGRAEKASLSAHLVFIVPSGSPAHHSVDSSTGSLFINVFYSKGRFVARHQPLHSTLKPLGLPQKVIPVFLDGLGKGSDIWICPHTLIYASFFSNKSSYCYYNCSKLLHSVCSSMAEYWYCSSRILSLSSLTKSACGVWPRCSYYWKSFWMIWLSSVVGL